MSEIAEERLFGLLEIAERQQTVAQMALEGLAAERMALAQERQQWADQLGQSAQDVRSAVQSALSDSIATVAETSTDAIRGATEPLLDTLNDMTHEAAQAEVALRGVVRWASWRLLLWSLALIAGVALLWWLAICAVLWWDSSAVGAAQLQKAQLEAEIAELKANRDAWEKAGLLGKVERCGPKNRPCVQVDESAGSYGKQSDYRIILGY